jgi:carboxyl-terminal processing protease
MEVPTTEEERIRYMVEMRKLDFVAGKPGAVGPNPPTASTPKGPDGKPVIDDSKPFEDRPLMRAIDVIKKKLAGG